METITIIWLSILTISFIINTISTREKIKGLSEVGAEMYGWYQDFEKRDERSDERRKLLLAFYDYIPVEDTYKDKETLVDEFLSQQ